MSYPFYGQTAMPQLYPSNSITQSPIGTEVIRVNGISGAYQCALPPGTKSILVTDVEKPLAYLITTDGVNRNVQAFDISLHQEPVQNNVTNNQHPGDSALEQTLKSINDKLSNLEAKVNELESNNTGTQPANSKYNKSGNGSNAAGH